LQRRTREVGADHDTIRAGKIEAHLAGAAADVNNARISGNRLVEEACKLTAFGTHVKRVKAISWGISGKRSTFVELSHLVGSRVAGKAKPRDSVWRIKYGAALVAG
jgi:hypothetical protein